MYHTVVKYDTYEYHMHVFAERSRRDNRVGGNVVIRTSDSGESSKQQ